MLIYEKIKIWEQNSWIVNKNKNIIFIYYIKYEFLKYIDYIKISIIIYQFLFIYNYLQLHYIIILIL